MFNCPAYPVQFKFLHTLAVVFTTQLGEDASKTASEVLFGTPDPVPSASQLPAVPQLKSPVVFLQIGILQLVY
jgi:hypothetical protein